MIKKIRKPIIIFVMALLVLPSCSLLRPASEHAAVYQSFANSQADIRLDLKDNYRFEYDMTIYPELAGPESDVAEHFRFRGRWAKEDQNYVLRFRRRNKPDLYALFGQVGDMESNVRVINERRVSFPLADKEIVIWGIVCFREKK